MIPINLKTDTGGVIVVLAVVAVITILSSFLYRTLDERLVNHYSDDVYHAFSELKTTAALYRQGESTDEKLIKAVNTAQKEFKRIAFILNYYYPDFKEGNRKVEPIFRISRDGIRASVNKPEGLEYLEELVYNNPNKNTVEIDQLASNFQAAFAKVKLDLDGKAIPEGELISAMREELITIVTIESPAVDRSGTMHGIEESKYALFSLKTFSIVYFEEDSKDIVRRLETAMAYLDKHADSNTFDRTVFIREHVDPIYARLRNLAFDRNITLQDNHGKYDQNSKTTFARDFGNMCFAEPI